MFDTFSDQQVIPLMENVHRKTLWTIYGKHVHLKQYQYISFTNV